jgi:hypothetical protein
MAFHPRVVWMRFGRAARGAYFRDKRAEIPARYAINWCVRFKRPVTKLALHGVTVGHRRPFPLIVGRSGAVAPGVPGGHVIEPSQAGGVMPVASSSRIWKPRALWEGEGRGAKRA